MAFAPLLVRAEGSCDPGPGGQRLEVILDKVGARLAEIVSALNASARLIEGALPTEGAIAHVLVSKYAEHTPLYRQSQIYARSGLDLDRSTLAG